MSRKTKKVIVGDRNAALPESFDIPMAETNPAVIVAWFHRMQEIRRAMAMLDRYLMIYDDGDDNLCLASIPYELEAK